MDKTTLHLSQLERYCVFVIFSAERSWGGTEDDLLARDDIYEALDLAAFEEMDPATTEVKTLDRRTCPHDVDPARLPYLLKAIVVSGQSRDLGRTTSKIVRKVRAALKPAEGASAAALEAVK